MPEIKGTISWCWCRRTRRIAALCLSFARMRSVRRKWHVHLASGTTYVGTRNLPGDLGSNYGAVTAQKTIGNSNYNSLETTLRFTPGAGSNVLIGYTYSKSIDQASQYGEQLNPFNQRLTRAISAWDMTQQLRGDL